VVKDVAEILGLVNGVFNPGSEYQVKISEPLDTVLEELKATPSVVGSPEQTLGKLGVMVISPAVAKGNTLTVTVKGLPIGAFEVFTGVTV
jgi:hypothetical protein